jgi:tripartite-type tricarboxylate transporter receptor subunit TctC
VGPAKLPQPIVATLLKALNESIHTELFKTRIQELGMTIPDAASNTPEGFAAYMRAERERQAELARLSGHDPMSPK